MKLIPRSLLLLTLFGTVAVHLHAQEPDRPQSLQKLRAEQDEILRKAVRMKELMGRLQQRYERENKPEQVALLKQGIQHLDQSAILKDVASIRDDLSADALGEAVRKQQQVITDLERLLNILLQRKSIENLDQTMQQATEMAATARELERRQAELQQRTQEAANSAATPAEQQLQEQLQQLSREQQREAAANARAAGSRRPFLENALQRVNQLLQQQQAAESESERQENGAAAKDRERAFAIGELVQRTRELSAQVRDQATTAQLEKEAEALAEAARGQDPTALQQQKDRLESSLQKAPKQPGGAEGPKADAAWQELRKQLDQASGGNTEAERKQLEQLASRADQLAEQRTAEAKQRNGDAAKKLAEQAAKTAANLAGSEPASSDGKTGEQSPSEPNANEGAPSGQQQQQQNGSPKGNPAGNNRETKATEPSKTDPSGATPNPEASAKEAQPSPNESPTSSSPSQKQPQQQPQAQPQSQSPSQGAPQDRTAPSKPKGNSSENTPAAAVRSGQQHLQKAAEAAQAGETARAQDELQQAQRDFETARKREQEQHPDAAKLTAQMAAEADATEKELRNAPSPGAEEGTAAEALDRAEQALRNAEQKLQNEGAEASAQAKADLNRSREQLQQAKATLEQALQSANSDRQGDLQQAADRQQQLQQQAEQLQQAMQQMQQSGSLNEKQAKSGSEQVAKAKDAMQRAQQQLQQGQQSQASSQQQEAASALQQAQQELQKNRTPGQEQQQAMQKLAEAEQKLEQDILKLAEEAKKRENKEAQRALDEAADAARRSQRAMQQNDQDGTEQQQERARQKLDEAAKQLEEERDRYQDLRQEELLFKMREELTAFLDKQKPITLGTLEVQKSGEKDGLSRPARRKLNQYGEEEQELSGKLQALIAALADEGNLVWQAVLKANREDLTEVTRRLGGRNPDPSNYTTMLQQAVERRTTDLLAALEREQKRREQQRQEEQQQQQQQQDKKDQGKNRFNQQRQKLVSLIAELELLKTLEADTRRATSDLQTLLSLRSGDDISEAEAALVERLAHRHGDVTKMFQQIKAGVEEAMQSMQGEETPESGKDQGAGGGGR